MLAVDGVVTRYGRIKALKGVSIEVREGEIVSIIGANGAGKTTLLKTIAGVLASSEGSVEFRGKRIDALGATGAVREGISLVPEGRRVFGNLTVKDNLVLGAYLRLKTKDRRGIEDDLHRVLSTFPVLDRRSSQLAGSLSGGEQQMLAIGRALMAKPRLLLLDEPSMGLAPLIIAEIYRTILDLHERGMTILLVEQNARIALQVARRAYVMETGTVALEAPVDELANDERVRTAYLGE